MTCSIRCKRANTNSTITKTIYIGAGSVFLVIVCGPRRKIKNWNYLFLRFHTKWHQKVGGPDKNFNRMYLKQLMGSYLLCYPNYPISKASYTRIALQFYKFSVFYPYKWCLKCFVLWCRRDWFAVSMWQPQENADWYEQNVNVLNGTRSQV
jgi:hypothetical protein